MQNRPIKNLVQFLNKEFNFMPTDINRLIGNFTYCCPDQECKRCHYKRKYCGKQDNVMNSIELLKYKDEELEFLASPVFQRSGNPDTSYRQMHYYPLIMPKTTIVKNFRLRNMNNVESIEIEIGGQRMDRIYKDVIPIMQNLYGVDEDVIPLYFSVSGINSLDYHEIKLRVEYNVTCDDDALIFDIYKWKNQRNINNVMYQLQFTGTDDLSGDGLKKVKLNFNHPVLHLMLKNYSPEILELEFDDGDKFEIKREKKIGDISLYSIADFFYDYKNGINFSRIDRAKIIVKDTDLQTIDIYAINTQPIRCMSGMAGLAFSM